MMTSLDPVLPWSDIKGNFNRQQFLAGGTNADYILRRYTLESCEVEQNHYRNYYPDFLIHSRSADFRFCFRELFFVRHAFVSLSIKQRKKVCWIGENHCKTLCFPETIIRSIFHKNIPNWNNRLKKSLASISIPKNFEILLDWKVMLSQTDLTENG